MKLNSYAQQAIIFKIAQRCNLNCDYCYVYNRGDDSWKYRPKLASPEVAAQLAQRIFEHCSLHNLPHITVELHGGEPLLIGKLRFTEIISELRSISNVDVRIVLQTNGLLLDSEWISIFSKNHIRFSISLDGPPPIADKHRKTHDGKGSTEKLLGIISQLNRFEPSFKELCSGYLAVIDPSSNGADVFDWFVDNGFDSFDFLIPDGNISNPPSGSLDGLTQFLTTAFDSWCELLVLDCAPRVRIFEVALLGALGFSSDLDANGADISSMCVVESNGSIGCHDVLRMCGGEFSKDKLNIADHPLGVHPDLYRLASIQPIPDKCQKCSVVDACGGGYLPHRFDGEMFNNPSYWCEALFAFYTHAKERVLSGFPYLKDFSKEAKDKLAKQRVAVT